MAYNKIVYGGNTLLDIVGEYAGEDVRLQAKIANPSTSQHTVVVDSGYDGLSNVTVTVIPTGTVSNPVATKGAVSNHSITVTPSVTTTDGNIYLQS